VQNYMTTFELFCRMKLKLLPSMSRMCWHLGLRIRLVFRTLQGTIMNYKMKIFGAIMIAHWLEHLFQAYQVYVLHMDRACALGLLGMKYPWLIRTESLHFGFALLTLTGIWYAGKDYFASLRAAKVWLVAYYAAIWHLFEHLLLFVQAVFGVTHPTSLIQLIVPRIELHLFYNSVVTILIVLALIEERMYRNLMKFVEEHNEEECEFCHDHDHNHSC